MNLTISLTILLLSALFLVFADDIVDPNDIPDFGHKPNINNRSGICDGIKVGDEVSKISCFCPPELDVFIEAVRKNVKEGYVVNKTGPRQEVSFPKGDDIDSKIARMSTLISTLLNMRGPGVGCSINSTTYGLQFYQLVLSKNPSPDSPPPSTPTPDPPSTRTRTLSSESVSDPSTPESSPTPSPTPPPITFS